MNFKELFKKYHKRLVIEGVLSAAMIGLAVGSLATAILAALSWCFGIGSLWLAIGVGVGVAAIIAAPIPAGPAPHTSTSTSAICGTRLFSHI